MEDLLNYVRETQWARQYVRATLETAHGETPRIGAAIIGDSPEGPMARVMVYGLWGQEVAAVDVPLSIRRYIPS